MLNFSTLSLKLRGDKGPHIPVRLFQMTLKSSGILDPPVTEAAMLAKVLGMRRVEQSLPSLFPDAGLYIWIFMPWLSPGH